MTAPATSFKWGNFDDASCDEFARWIGKRKVLEIFAGNGLLASMLSWRNVDITSTSLFHSDGHELGMHFDVVEMDSTRAVKTYGEDHDILLMCWPRETEDAFRATAEWGSEKPIMFIGEVTDLSKGMYGGCGSDNFFETTDELHVFEDYTPKNMLDRAAVRQLNAAKFARWKAAQLENVAEGRYPIGILMPLVLD